MRRVRRAAGTPAGALPQRVLRPCRPAYGGRGAGTQHGRRGARKGRRRASLRGAATRDAHAAAAAEHAPGVREQHAHRAVHHRLSPRPAAGNIRRRRAPAAGAALGGRRIAADPHAEDPRPAAPARAHPRSDGRSGAGPSSPASTSHRASARSRCDSASRCTAATLRSWTSAARAAAARRFAPRASRCRTAARSCATHPTSLRHSPR